MCAVWHDRKVLVEMTCRGSHVSFVARVQVRPYENQSGERCYVSEDIVQSYNLLETKEVTNRRRKHLSEGQPAEEMALNEYRQAVEHIPTSYDEADWYQLRRKNMDKYHNIVIQRSIKQELKYKSLYILDLLIVFGPSMFLLYLQGYLHFSLVTSILLGIVFFFLGLFLCAKPASNGNRRNLYTIYCLIVMDRNVYEVQSYKKRRG